MISYIKQSESIFDKNIIGAVSALGSFLVVLRSFIVNSRVERRTLNRVSVTNWLTSGVPPFLLLMGLLITHVAAVQY